MPGQMCNIKLLTEMVAKAKAKVDEEGEELTAILIPGDFINHDLPEHDFTIPNPNWD